jgi:hypothetical protein
MDNVQHSGAPPSSPLCERCRGNFSGSWLQSWAMGGARKNVATYYHHPDLISLQACATHRDGCPLCVTLYDRLRRVGRQLNSLHENPEDAYLETKIKCVIIWGRNTVWGRNRPEVETPCIQLGFSLESSTNEATSRGVFLHHLDLWPAERMKSRVRARSRLEI